MQLLSPADLEARGIRYSRSQRNRLIRAGKFPKPIRFGDNGWPLWPDTEIEEYVARRIAERDGTSTVVKDA